MQKSNETLKLLNSDLKLTGKNFKYTEKSTHSYKQRIKELDGTTQVIRKTLIFSQAIWQGISRTGRKSAEAQNYDKNITNKQMSWIFRKRTRKNNN